ncbi:unnamed protein product [Heterobilharzia americana]|nr:unnamed protein product [Heterobilharzia americana]
MGLLPLLDASDVLVLHCPLCYFHTHWLNHLEIHFNHEHSSENVDFMLYQCSVCRKIASCKTFLNEHIDIRHKRNVKSTLQSCRTQSPNDTIQIMRIHVFNQQILKSWIMGLTMPRLQLLMRLLRGVITVVIYYT